MWITDSRMLCSLPSSCLVHPVDRVDSEGCFTSYQVTRFNCFVFLVKKHEAFKWKDAISGCSVSPGSAEALIKWGGKIKYILIAYFLGNICAKNCRNRTMCVKIIASQIWEAFETQCILDLGGENPNIYRFSEFGILWCCKLAAYEKIERECTNASFSLWNGIKTVSVL